VQRVGDPIDNRFVESEHRAAAFDLVSQTIQAQRELAASMDSKYEHIGAEDRAKVLAKCAEVEKDIQAKLATLQAQPKHEKPQFTNAEITAFSKVSAQFFYCNVHCESNSYFSSFFFSFFLFEKMF
jgi:heat shock protein 4